jgi:hypothetical protein
LTRAITFIALTGLLVIGAAAASILTRDSFPVAEADARAATVQDPIPNREAKADKVGSATLALASAEPEQARQASETLRQAFAASVPTDIGQPRAPSAPAASASTQPAPMAQAQPKPKPPKLPVQKPYSLLSDTQIAGIKERLRLSASQESYWPGVEKALRAVARKIYAARQTNPDANAASLDPNSAEVQQLKSAAMPLLFQLREDQKEEVRKLARIIGLDQVAAAI